MTLPAVTIWPDPPGMSTGAPHPTFERDADSLWLAYRTYREDHFAVLRFVGVRAVFFGDPNDQAPNTHRLYAAGLDRHAFHEVHGDPAVKPPLRRWILIFHHDAFDITAQGVEIVARAIQAPSAGHAIANVRA
jgi:hypothetical protein